MRTNNTFVLMPSYIVRVEDGYTSSHKLAEKWLQENRIVYTRHDGDIDINSFAMTFKWEIPDEKDRLMFLLRWKGQYD